MDIICARCGKHLNSIEAAREHRCKDISHNEPFQFRPSKKSTISPEEWDRLVSSINAKDVEQEKPIIESEKETDTYSVAPRSNDPFQLSVVKTPCPVCKNNLLYNNEEELWKCKYCNRVYTYDDLYNKRPQPNENQSNEYRDSSGFKESTGKIKNGKDRGLKDGRRKRELKKFVPDWAIALILIFALTLIGFAISRFTETEIPLYLLFGFSVIYSIEKWLRYYIRANKNLGKIYRLLINLSILSLLGLTIWTGIQLFSQKFLSNTIIASSIFAAECVLFIWMWRVVSRNSWRWPSMKFTTFSLICLFLIFSFAGVKPLAEYKDTVVDKVSDFFTSDNPTSNSEEDGQLLGEDDLAVENSGEENMANTPAATTVIVSKIDPRTGEYKNYFMGLVKTSTGVLSGSECYGEFIVLINNKNAENPTHLELLEFLKADKTDTFPYQLTVFTLDFYYGDAEDQIDLEVIADIIDGLASPDDPRVCADFAERLHNEAEKAGIRCGYVSIDSINHALCVFETTNRGLVFIDDTGKLYNFGPSNCDKAVDVEEGKEYIPVSLFPEPGWYDEWESLGIIEGVFITWDGDWR